LRGEMLRPEEPPLVDVAGAGKVAADAGSILAATNRTDRAALR